MLNIRAKKHFMSVFSGVAANASPPRILYLTNTPACGSSINGVMNLLSHIRSRSRLKNTHSTCNDIRYQPPPAGISNGQPKPHPSSRFSTTLFRELFSYVCPHSRDDSYISCEESMIDGGCMLCDMRDLSQCVLVNKQWAEVAQTIL